MKWNWCWMNKWMLDWSWMNEWMNEWMCCNPPVIVFKRMPQDFWSWFKEITEYPDVAETFFPSVFSKEEHRRGKENSLDYVIVLLMTQNRPSFNASVNSKPDHPPRGGGFFESVRLISDIFALNKQMIIILRQFCLQLILKRPQLIIVVNVNVILKRPQLIIVVNVAYSTRSYLLVFIKAPVAKSNLDSSEHNMTLWEKL